MSFPRKQILLGEVLRKERKRWEGREGRRKEGRTEEREEGRNRQNFLGNDWSGSE